jgi:hypothetical protein
LCVKGFKFHKEFFSFYCISFNKYNNIPFHSQAHCAFQDDLNANHKNANPCCV